MVAADVRQSSATHSGSTSDDPEPPGRGPAPNAARGSAPMRACAYCGGSLIHRRRDALYCGAPCRAAASRARVAEPSRDFWTALRTIQRPRTARRRTQSAMREGAPGAPVGKLIAQDKYVTRGSDCWSPMR